MYLMQNYSEMFKYLMVYCFRTLCILLQIIIYVVVNVVSYKVKYHNMDATVLTGIC